MKFRDTATLALCAATGWSLATSAENPTITVADIASFQVHRITIYRMVAKG